MCPVCEYGLFYFYIFLFFILEVGQSEYGLLKGDTKWALYGLSQGTILISFVSYYIFKWNTIQGTILIIIHLHRALDLSTPSCILSISCM